ncbi:MAG: NAD(P)/FAD-dependent oxidoreductase [Bacillota bacterium]
MPDVLVIGGGPAGGLGGLLLARAGVSVTIVDQHRFPRDKVCGECLSPLGIGVLRRAGVLEQLQRAGAVWMTRFCLHSMAGRSAVIRLPGPMLGISRLQMDQLLLGEAQKAGTIVRQHVRCEGMRQETMGGKVWVRLRDLEHNAVEETTARQVLVADGRGMLLQRRPRATGDFGIKAHFANVEGPRDAVELFGVKGHYGGLAPVEQGLWNVAFSVPGWRLKECPDLDALFAQITRENEVLRDRMTGAWRVGGWRTAPLLRYGVPGDWPAGVIPIGNAAAAIEPIGGEGMGLALRSAELAAVAIAGKGVDPARLAGEFRRLWRMRRVACRLAGLVVSRPGLCATAVAILSGSEGVGRWVMRCTGKMEVC